MEIFAYYKIKCGKWDNKQNPDFERKEQLICQRRQ